jgi:cytochrome c-type biogenesis protein
MLILFGGAMLGASRIPFISREWRIQIPPALTLGKWQSSFAIGTLFAFGWSPCVGPILGTVLLLASQSAIVFTGGLLLFVFSAGLGVPFILTALLMGQANTLFSRWGVGLSVLSKIGGLLLVVFGFVILFGAMGNIVSFAYGLFEWLGYSRLYNYL